LGVYRRFVRRGIFAICTRALSLTIAVILIFCCLRTNAPLNFWVEQLGGAEDAIREKLRALWPIV